MSRLCSTPFGITEVLTPALRLQWPWLRCAQRLSASQRFSLARVGKFDCYVKVLNAFRHHIGSHKDDAVETIGISSGAQRLSASQRFSHQAARRDVLCVGVLNAFRHHRGSHKDDAVETIGISSGAQRLSASQRFSPQRHVGIDQSGGCSTPFGITEVLTQGEGGRLQPSRVLNAFRHHRGSHMIIGWPYAINQQCSTPFGITEVLTRTISTTVAGSSGAQRLSASQRFSQGRLCNLPIGQPVLNAFRHHRGSHPLASRRESRPGT